MQGMFSIRDLALSLLRLCFLADRPLASSRRAWVRCLARSVTSARYAVGAGQSLDLTQAARELENRVQAALAEADQVHRYLAQRIARRRHEQSVLHARELGELVIEEVGRRDAEEAGERLEVAHRRVVLGACAQLPEVGRRERDAALTRDGRGYFAVRVLAVAGTGVAAEKGVDPLCERRVHLLPVLLCARRTVSGRAMRGPMPALMPSHHPQFSGFVC